MENNLKLLAGFLPDNFTKNTSMRKLFELQEKYNFKFYDGFIEDGGHYLEFKSFEDARIFLNYVYHLC